MIDDWRDVLETTACEVLDSAGIDQPPVDAFRLAEVLGIAVAVDADQPSRGRRKTLGGRPAVFLRPDDRPERLQWALAHELGELYAWKAAERAWSAEALPAGMREEIASQLAARILLPGDWFFRDAARLDDDVVALKARYTTASHALIAMRLLDRDVATVVSIFDQGSLTCRRSNCPASSAAPTPAEESVREAMQSPRTPQSSAIPGGMIRGWPIDEPGRERDIVVMTFDEADDEFGFRLEECGRSRVME